MPPAIQPRLITEPFCHPLTLCNRKKNYMDRMIDKHVPVVSYGTNLRPFYSSIPPNPSKTSSKKKNVSSSFDNSLLYIKIHSIFHSIIYTIRSFSKRILFHFKKKNLNSQLILEKQKSSTTNLLNQSNSSSTDQFHRSVESDWEINNHSFYPWNTFPLSSSGAASPIFCDGRHSPFDRWGCSHPRLRSREN